VAARWQRLRADDRDRGHISWLPQGIPSDRVRDVLPLRRLPPVDAGRVKSYRRQLREGILPPVLLWWVSGLDTLLVVDGHDRIAAALAEGTVPEVLVLSAAQDPGLISGMRQHAVRAYAQRLDHLRPRADQGDPFAGVHVAKVNRRLAAELVDIDRSEGRTRAWQLRGGRVEWDRQAATLAPGWITGTE
jgi:hypothetical protein